MAQGAAAAVAHHHSRRNFPWRTNLDLRSVNRRRSRSKVCARATPTRTAVPSHVQAVTDRLTRVPFDRWTVVGRRGSARSPRGPARDPLWEPPPVHFLVLARAESRRATKTMASRIPFPNRFYAAVGFAANPPLGARAVTDETRLLLYALYQQATAGPCRAPKPWGWNAIESAKWSSWTQLGDVAALDAMRMYVSTMEEENPDWFSLFTDGGDPARVAEALEAAAEAVAAAGAESDLAASRGASASRRAPPPRGGCGGALAPRGGPHRRGGGHVDRAHEADRRRAEAERPVRARHGRRGGRRVRDWRKRGGEAPRRRFRAAPAEPHLAQGRRYGGRRERRRRCGRVSRALGARRGHVGHQGGGDRRVPRRQRLRRRQSGIVNRAGRVDAGHGDERVGSPGSARARAARAGRAHRDARARRGGREDRGVRRRGQARAPAGRRARHRPGRPKLVAPRATGAAPTRARGTSRRALAAGRAR